MIDISLQNIAKSYGAFQVLDNISFELHTKERVGLIGENGSGKTTIFRIMTGEEPVDQGTITTRKGLTMGCLQQIPDYPENITANQVLKQAFSEHYQLQARLKHLEGKMTTSAGDKLQGLMTEYGTLQQQFEAMGGYQVEAEIEAICNGLKISINLRDRSFQTLSGGEKTTITLARLLLEKPDLLLLDEPTNHLDVESLEWLEEFLLAYPGTVCAISHDRYFLDRVVSKIIEVEDGNCQTFSGNYSHYSREKEQQLQIQFEQYQDQQKKIKAMERAIRDMKEWGNRADNPKFHKRAASMQKRLDRMEKIERVVERSKLKLDFQDAKRSGNDVFQVEDLSFGYDQHLLLDRVNFSVRYGERVAILGRNGTGKSTLLKLLLEQYAPLAGTINLGARVKLGYCEQEVRFSDEELTVIETFRDSHPCTSGRARDILAKFLFFGQDVFKKVKDLSGGERSRLRLCQLIQKDINLLVLDEPTNHLDIDAIEVLEEALLDFTGTIIFISHDRYFINKITDRVLELAGGRIYQYLGDYDYYKQKKKEKMLSQAGIPPADSKRRKPVGKTKNKQDSLKDLEQQISDLESVISAKEQELAKWATDYEKLACINSELCVHRNDLDELLAKWVELSQ